VGAGFEGVYEDLQTGRVPRQLEQPHDADDAEELENVVVDVQLVEEGIESEGQRSDDVDDVDRGPEVEQLLRTDNEANDDLEGEPGVADALQIEEGRVGVGGDELQAPALLSPHLVGDVAVRWAAQVRMGLEAEAED